MNFFCNLRFCDIIMLFVTTHNSFWNHKVKLYDTPQYHFTMFLHFAIEIKNKQQIHNFSESSKGRMQRLEEPHATR